jgi:hypothetical protein
MEAPTDFVKIINRKRYSVRAAQLIASDAYWDGYNFERSGRNTFLYRTEKGNYFTVTLTQLGGEMDQLAPITQDLAIELFEGPLSKHEVGYHEAFPDVTVTDA